MFFIKLARRFCKTHILPRPGKAQLSCRCWSKKLAALKEAMCAFLRYPEMFGIPFV
jgi:hypothetical protein